MGEMSRPRKDLAASFHRLRRMVVDVKSARKSLVAHHSLIAELVSVALYPSSKGPLQRDDPQEERPLPSNPPPCPPSPPNDLQELGIETQNSLPCSSAPSKTPENPSFSSLRSLTSKISASFSTLPQKNGAISCRSPSHQEAESNFSKILTSAAYPSKRLSQPAFWASLFLVFLGFFLYTGKGIAVVVSISAYIILWLTRRLRVVERQSSDNREAVDSGSYDEDNHVQEIPGINLSRSSMSRSDGIIFCSSDSQGPPRSRSCPILHGSLQEEVCSKEHDLSLYPQFSAATFRTSQSLSARVKLSMVLVLALCGLAYSHIAAVCLCSCCIALLSITQESTMRRYRRASSEM